MTKRKKPFYPQSRPTRRPAPAGTEALPERPNLATINLQAGAGRAGFAVGDRVRIEGGGTYSGEIATIERLSAGVIPSALVRTEGGGTRQVRTIDLVPAKAEPKVEAKAEPNVEATVEAKPAQE